MQVEREAILRGGGKGRTGEERVGTYPTVRNNHGKLWLIPYTPLRGERFIAVGVARVGLGSWWGKGLPSLRSLAGLRG